MKRTYWQKKSSATEKRQPGAPSHLFDSNCKGMKTTLLACLIILGLHIPAFTQITPTQNQQIDSIIGAYLKADQPGGSVAIIRGKDIYTKHLGVADIQTHRQLDHQSVYNIASVSKTFTGYAIWDLARQGKIKLSDNITKYLDFVPDYGHNITIGHLLQHTSGIPSTDVLRLFAGLRFDTDWTQQDELQLITRYPELNFTPGDQHLYSNSGYTLLASIVEKVSGQPFGRYLQQRIFAPLRMPATKLLDQANQLTPYTAKGYKLSETGIEEFGSDKDLSYGGGNIYASLPDMINWARHLISEPGFFKSISTPLNALNSGEPIPYTYGFYLRTHKGLQLVEHSGGVPGFRNQFMLFPEENLAVIVMLNNESIPSRRLALGLAEALLAGKLQDEKPKVRTEIGLDLEKASQYAGSFQMSDGMILNFVLEQDTFWLELPGAPRFQLFAESPTQFFLKAFDAQCSFLADASGQVHEMIWHQGGKDFPARRTFEYIPLDAAQLSQMAGSYMQKALQTSYEITLEDAQLMLYLPETFATYLGFSQTALTHIQGDLFQSDQLGMLGFTRSDTGLITGFVLQDVGRIKNIRFEKK